MRLAHGLGTAALRGGLVVSLASLAAGAGAQSRPDSVPLTFGVHLPRSDRGAAVGRVDSSQTGQSSAVRATTFSELLAARVPGMSVLRSSGTSGTGSRVRLRGYTGLFGLDEPLLVVDGIVTNADQRSLGVDVGGQTPSRLDDLSPDEVERIDVLRGPAAAALFGMGAASGVIVVTTRLAAPGPLRASLFAEAGAVSQESEFEPNYRRLGQTPAGTPAVDCSLREVAAGRCIPQSLLSADALRDADAFQTAARTVVGGSVAGGVPLASYSATARTESEGGALGPNRVRRSSARAQLLTRPSSALELRATGGAGRHVLDLPFDLLLLRRYLLRRPGFDREPFDQADRFYTIATRQTAVRLSGAVTARWQARRWLALQALHGIDDVDRDDRHELPPLPQEGTTVLTPYRLTTAGGDVATRTSALGASSEYGLPGSIAAATQVGAHWVRERRSFAAFDSVGSGDVFSKSESRAWARTRMSNVYVRQQLGWRDRLTLAGGVVRGGGGVVGLKRRGARLYPFADATVGLAGPRHSRQSAWLRDLRARAAYGSTGDARRLGSEISSRVGGPFEWVTSEATAAEHVHETEFGLDADIGGRVRVEATRYRKVGRDLLRRFQNFNGPALVRNGARVRNAGAELLVSAAIAEGARVGWDVTVGGATNRSTLLRVDGPPYTVVDVNSFGGTQFVENGRAVGTFISWPYRYADTDGDGIVGEDELTRIPDENTRVLLSPFPEREALLRSELRLFQRWRLAAHLDYRGRFSKANGTEAWRCLQRRCRSAQDPSASLDDQARAIASGLVGSYTEEVSFLRLRELSATIELPRGWTAAIGGRDARVTVAGRNLATWTGYSGGDPEVNAGGQNALGQVEYFTQPLVRHVTAGVTIRW